ncbi:MAG: polysaccharide pyruvyl transferase family protein [Wenzhouxiangella sp.]
MAGSPRRIFLLTPYTGGNLGDQAIQLTLIENLRKRCPNADFIGLTLNPRATATIHNIPCFPLSPKAAGAKPGTGLYWPEEPTALPDEEPMVTGARSEATSVAGTPEPLPASTPLNARIRSRLVACLRRVPFLPQTVRTLRALPREIVFTVRAARLLRRGDLLIVAGGGQIADEWGEEWAQPFSLWRWTALARLRGARIAVASAGSGRLRSALSRRLIYGALRRADYRSYRDQGSAVKAESLGLPDRNRCVPDIALGLPLPRGRMRLPAHAGTTVGLSPIAYGRQGIWPITLTEIHENYLHRLAAFMSGLTAQDLRVVVFTSSHMDRAVVDDLLEIVRGLPDTRTDLIEVAETTSLGSLLEVLGTCDLVVASRLHGVILSHRLGIPTLAISHHRKVHVHMDEMGQAQFCLEIERLKEGDLEKRFKSMLSHADVLHDELCRIVDAARMPLDTQFDKLASLVCATPSRS